MKQLLRIMAVFSESIATNHGRDDQSILSPVPPASNDRATAAAAAATEIIQQGFKRACTR